MIGGRFIPDHEKRCPECGRTTVFPGGWFPNFDTYQRHLTDIAVNHALEYVKDHPSLIAMLDQADAAERDKGGAS